MLNFFMSWRLNKLSINQSGHNSMLLSGALMNMLNIVAHMIRFGKRSHEQQPR
jgi:hypothetical protein